MITSSLLSPHPSMSHWRRLYSALIAVLCLGGLASAATAQPRDVLTVTAASQRETTAPGDQFTVAVVLAFEEGWHAWPNKPVIPEALAEDLVAIPTTVQFAKDAAAPTGVNIFFDRAQWPEAHEIESAGFTGEPLKILSYSGRAVVYVPVTISEDAKPGEVFLTLQVSYQACNDSMCMQPTSAEATVKFEIAAAGATVKTSANEAEFKGFDPAIFAKIHSGTPPPAPSSSTSTPVAKTPASAASDNVAPSLFGYQLPDPKGVVGGLILFLVAVVGGALMNLTPCVLPVIPVKVMTLTQHASGGSAVRLGMWMALGVVAFWTAAGIPMAFIGAALDPSRLIFGTWWITLGLGLIIVAMGFGIMGMFNITLPQSVYKINPKVDTAWGSFVFGIMTAVLGLPCYAFVAGGLLAGAATWPPLTTLSVFVGMGVGMAAPYLVLAAKPAMLKKIPRTGPASELVKQVMGLLLMAAAAFFIAVGLQTLISTKPWIGTAMEYWAVAFLITLAGLWLMLRTFQITSKPVPRVVFSTISILLIVGSVAFAISESNIEKENHLKLMASQKGSDEVVSGAWNHYTPAKFEAARKSGKIVVADFTANWCLICKSLKRTVLDREPVQSKILSDDVVVFEVDLSADDAPGWEFLRSIGRTGIPTLAIFSPDAEQPEIFNAYTSANVMEAIERARQKDVASRP